MNIYEDSTDRRSGEYFLFALGFAGFLMAAAGLVLSVPGVAIMGVIVLFIGIAPFARWTEA